MRRIKFTDFPTESSVSLETLQGARIVKANASTWGEEAGFATFTSVQWSLADEPSVTGDTAMIDFVALPKEPGHTASFFEVLKDDGVIQVIEMVLMGPLLNNPRRIRVSAGTITSVQVRVIWIEDTTGFEIAGRWSPAKTVIPTIGEPVLSITASRTTGVAPVGIQFKAELSGSGELRPYYDVRYKWAFPETGAYEALPANFEWSRDRQVDFGPVCAFTFETPNATATVICEATFYNSVTGQNQTITNTIQVQIDDPATVFAGTATITVGDRSQGDDYNAADIATAAGEIAGVASGQSRRLSLRRGLSYGPVSISTNFNLARLSVTAHGPGGDPVVTSFDIRELQSGGELTFSNLNAVGPYDPSDPAGTTVESDHFQVQFSGVPVTLHSCRSVGARKAIYCNLDGLVVSDTEIRNWFDYGIFGNNGPISVVGSSIRQSSDIQRLGDGKNGRSSYPLHADHGPYRQGGDLTGASCFSKCDIFSNNNWGDTTQPQLPLRWNSGGKLGGTFYLNMCQIEGGTFGFGVNAGNGRGYTPQYLLCERFRHIATGSPIQAATVVSGGTTFRNFIIVQPDVPAEGADTARQVVRLGVGTADLMNGGHLHPVEVYSGILVDLRSEANATPPFDPTRIRETRPFFEDDRGYAFLAKPTTDNNIFYAPNRTNGEQNMLAEPLDLTASRKPYYAGAKVTDLVDITYSNLTGASFVNSNKTRVTLTGSTSGATAHPYGLDISGQIAAIMTSAQDFQVGETVTVSGDGTGTFTVGEATPRNQLIERFANNPVDTATFAPLAQSTVLAAATIGKVALDDWNGILRSITLSTTGRTASSPGPFEPVVTVAPDFNRANATSFGTD